MRRVNPQQFAAMTEHLEGDHSTLQFALVGGHRVTLISLEDPGPDGLIVGSDLSGNRVELDPVDVSATVYVKADERVMTPDEIQSYKAGNATAPGPDGSIRMRRRRGKSPKQSDAGTG